MLDGMRGKVVVAHEQLDAQGIRGIAIAQRARDLLLGGKR